MSGVWGRAVTLHSQTVQHPFPPRLLEVDIQFVAFDLGDGAAAEFLVEHALASREAGVAGVNEADGAGLCLKRGGNGHILVASEKVRLMEAMRRLEVELPEELAEWVFDQVGAGRFESVSDAAGCGLATMQDQDADAANDPELEDWLRTIVVPRLEKLENGRAETKTIDEVRASLAARRAERDQAA